MLDINFVILTLCGQVLAFFDQITFFLEKGNAIEIIHLVISKQCVTTP